MLKELWLTWILVSGLGESVTINAQATVNLTVVIDGYTVNSTLTSPATPLPLGRTALLVCRVSGIPHGQQTSYQWTCPNQCLQTGFAGRKIDNNIIAINTTSTRDGGTYTCTVTAGGMEGRQQFRIIVAGGAVVHSYGRLLVHEAVITDRRQLQPPNDDTGDGRIECTISGGRSRFSFSQYRVDSRNTRKLTVVIPNEDFESFNNFDGYCENIYLYLFLKKSERFPQVRSLNLTTASTQSITATVEFNRDWNTRNGIERAITGYHRLDLGHEMVGKFLNNQKTKSVTFSGLVAGARYRITAWGLGGGASRKRGRAPAVLEVTTEPSVPSPPRALTITRVFEGRIELNWLTPRESNGDIQYYIIRYTIQNGTAQEINTTDNTNYYNLTGLEGGQTYYNFTVKAVNLAHTSAQSNTMIGSYTHSPGSLNTPTTKSGTSTATTPTTAVITDPSPPRAFTITRVFEDGIELNWLPRRETNGDIQHYIIRYTLQNGTAQEITTTDNTNYYNLTGLEGGQTYYNFTVEAVNLAHTSAQSNTIGSYTHSPGSLNTPSIKSATTPDFKPFNSTTPRPGTLVLYIGSGAGSLLLVLVAVLAVIICCVVAVHRRGKRSRSTDHTPTLHYYSTPGHEQEEEPQVQIGADNYDTVAEKTASYTLGTLYDEIEVKPVKSKPIAVPSEYQLPLVEAIKEDDKEVHNTVTIPESFYAQPDTTAKSNKKGEKGTTVDVEDPDVLYAEVDKPKKKKKGKEKKEEQPQGDLYAVVDKTSKKKGKGKKTKEKEQQGDGDLYAEVDKTKKKGKKCQKDKESNSFREAAVELDSPPPVPDRGLIYEPSADREASDQEQHHHQQQLQQQQQQEPEQQQQQLQKQEHEEGVEKQELQAQENRGPGKPSLN